MPYNVSLVELDEGPIVLSNVVNVKNEDLKIGMKLVVSFEALSDEAVIPVFVPSAD